MNVNDFNEVKNKVLNNDYDFILVRNTEIKAAVEFLKANLDETIYNGCNIETIVRTKNCSIVTVSCISSQSVCGMPVSSKCTSKPLCINHTMNSCISIFDGCSGTSGERFSVFRLIVINDRVKGFVIDTNDYYTNTETPRLQESTNEEFFYLDYISDLYFKSSPALYVRNFDAIENADVNHSTGEDGKDITTVSFFNKRSNYTSNVLKNGFSMDKSNNVTFIFENRKLIKYQYD